MRSVMRSITQCDTLRTSHVPFIVLDWVDLRASRARQPRRRVVQWAIGGLLAKQAKREIYESGRSHASMAWHIVKRRATPQPSSAGRQSGANRLQFPCCRGTRPLRRSAAAAVELQWCF